MGAGASLTEDQVLAIKTRLGDLGMPPLTTEQCALIVEAVLDGLGIEWVN